MSRATTWLFAKLSIWGAGLTAILSVSRLSFPGDHGICGPWGCGPPICALIACHGFWVFLLSPPTVVMIRRASARIVRGMGLLCAIAGVTALLAIGIWEWTHWYAAATDWERRYLVQRYLFSMVTLVDVPVVEITVIGIACLSTPQPRCSH